MKILPNRRHVFTAQEEDILSRDYANTPTAELAARMGLDKAQVYRKANAMRLTKSAEYLASPAAHRFDGVSTRGNGGFRKGNKPWNTGLKGLDIGGRSAETRFAVGGKPHNWRPIGTERYNRDGYLMRKVADTGYPSKDWQLVHRLVWEEHHGPIPPSHVVAFRDGDKTNIAPQNLELVHRADIQLRNSVHNLPGPLREVVLLKGRLTRVIKNRESGDEE